MSKQIEEVMDLVREYASESESFPTYSTLEDVKLAWKAIESKLRELLRNHEANKEALDEYFKKTDWVNVTFQSHELGHHRADVLRMRIEKLQKQVQK